MTDDGGTTGAQRPPRAWPPVTSGSFLREARMLTGQGLSYDLAAEAARLRQELQTTSGGRAAKTLAKAHNLRVALIALRAGTVLDPHAIAGGATLHVLAGRLTAYLGGRSQDVGVGELVVLDHNLREPLAALEDTIVLATIAWPTGAGAWDFEATGDRR